MHVKSWPNLQAKERSQTWVLGKQEERLSALSLVYCRIWAYESWNKKKQEVWSSCICRRSKKVCLVKAMIFPVVMYTSESWTIKKAESWGIGAFELWCWRRLLKSPLDSKEIKPVNHKGNQSWIFIGRTDAKTEAPILWPPDAKDYFIGKDSDAGKDWMRDHCMISHVSSAW